MAEVIEINTHSFKEQVLEASLPVLVDFWSPGCGPCQMMAPVLEELAAEYKGRLKVIKVNVAENMELSAQYGIMGVPTLILFKDGEQVETIVGFYPKNKLTSQLDRLI
ncbi:MAG TPA: thioredoxin [Firmicutes bacterium]|nr:thioredoxin [Bacillota bacterium]